jgi:transcriptional regulator GlxA family with amidase domain
MSERTFSRRFREQTGTTPMQWLLRARVRRAQYLLENSDYPIERIGEQAGFGSATAFRERFKRVIGTTPHGYRTAFRSRARPRRWASAANESITSGAAPQEPAA